MDLRVDRRAADASRREDGLCRGEQLDAALLSRLDRIVAAAERRRATADNAELLSEPRGLLREAGAGGLDRGEEVVERPARRLNGT